jgi:hypothetical protein
MQDRNRVSRRRQQRRWIQSRGRQLQAVEYFNALTGPELLAITEGCLPEHRERLYPPTVTLSLFLQQVLSADGSCQQAVDVWAVQRMMDGLRVGNTDTGAYCKARARLPLTMVQMLTRQTGRLLQTHDRWHWHGRHVRLVDGTGVSMPDTPENQARWPQPSTQAPGVGFPLARLVAVICLSTGAVVNLAIGPHAGKGHSELSLFRGLLDSLKPRDVLLGDALYCGYFEIAALQARQVDVVLEQHGTRSTDFRRGQKVGTRDHWVCWPKPRARPEWMSLEQYRAFPRQLCVREVDVGGRVLVTTLLDSKRVPKGELAELYRQRWQVELDLRNIKTTLSMDVLHCQTPAMVEKELWVYLLAYNLIRLLMVQAAYQAGVHPRMISFKHAVQLWNQWLIQAPRHRLSGYQTPLLELIAQRRVGNRPGRIEPRARKRRPKPYPWLKVPRAQARENLRNYGYP